MDELVKGYVVGDRGEFMVMELHPTDNDEVFTLDKHYYILNKQFFTDLNRALHKVVVRMWVTHLFEKERNHAVRD